MVYHLVVQLWKIIILEGKSQEFYGVLAYLARFRSGFRTLGKPAIPEMVCLSGLCLGYSKISMVSA